MSRLEATLRSIGPLDQEAMAAARARQDRLTKPLWALGRLEELSIQLAGITGRIIPTIERKAIIVMAADHGVVAEGVSAYPQAVTQQMVLNFLRGGAAVNVLARQVGAKVLVVDMGVAADLPVHPDLINRKVSRGTGNMAQEPAMSRSEAIAALEAGIEVFERCAEQGIDLVATGDMGIGNTTSSSAITAVFTHASVAQVTSRGTGINDAQLATKVAVIERALERNRPDPGDALDVLAKVGGFEIAGMAGVMLAAAAHRVPVVLDGFISGASALIAAGLNPLVKAYMIASHNSVEVGHALALKHLGLRPLLDLSLRLGEGSGAALAMAIVEAAARILGEMATFDEAGVSKALDTPPPRRA